MKQAQPGKAEVSHSSAESQKSEPFSEGLALPVQRQENRTGMPDNLKAGIENLSGMDMGDVKVHYNSAKPAQLQAHGYAQGTNIHVAPGQEKHLPHEAWHVVQQKQGRVRATRQLKGEVPINDNAGLEQEADRMGSRALTAGGRNGEAYSRPAWPVATAAIQRVITGEEAAVGKPVRKKPEGTLYKVTDYTPLGEKPAEYQIKPTEGKKPVAVPVLATDDGYDRLWPLGAEFDDKQFEAYMTKLPKDATALSIRRVYAFLKTQNLIYSLRKGKYEADVSVLAYIRDGAETEPVKTALYTFLNPSRHANTAEQFEKISAKYTNKMTYKEWFHSFTGTITLLAGRKDMDPQKMRQILKYQLTKFQIQATYGSDDGQRLGRQTSPLVLKGYARGIKTGLWNLNRKFQEEAVNAQLDKAPGGKGKRLAKEFYVFPANKGFQVAVPGSEPQRFMTLEDAETVPGDINTGSYQCVYVKSLRVQLVKFASAEAKSKQIGPVHSQMGGKGLRLSAGESADEAAGRIAEMIRQGEVDRAMEIVGEIFETPSEPVTEKPGKGEDSPKDAFGGMEFNPNTLLVPVTQSGESEQATALDPLTATSNDNLLKLEVQYRALVRNGTDKTLPFYILQNIQVVENLIGGSIGISRTGGAKKLFDQHTPTTVSADLTDALYNARQTIKRFREINYEPGRREFTPGSNRLVEQLYQQMQNIHHVIRFQLNWKGDGTTIASALEGMLPTAKVKPVLAQAAPHGLEMIHHIQQSLDPKDAAGVSYMKGAYYETPELFPGGKQKSDVADPSLKKDKVIVMEPHPNNAADREVHPHDPLVLLDTLFKEDPESGPYTVIMDVTLNHLGDEQIKNVLEKAEPFIASGKLNLILLQSGTKFFQNGMDLVNVGTSMTFNNGEGRWAEFNEKMKKHRENLPQEDKAYIANMLSKNKEPLRQYLTKVRANTGYMRAQLGGKLAEGDNAFEMCKNSDQDTVYVSFMPKAGYIHRCLSLKQQKVLKDVSAMETNSEELYTQALAVLNQKIITKKRDKLLELLGPQRKSIEALLKKKEGTKNEKEKQAISQEIGGKLRKMKLKKQLTLVLNKNITAHIHQPGSSGDKLYNSLSTEDIAAVNQELYFKHVLPALKENGQASVDRSSFGFNVTNFGECYTTVRITLGIEDEGFLEKYARIVAGVGAAAHQKAYAK